MCRFRISNVNFAGAKPARSRPRLPAVAGIRQRNALRGPHVVQRRGEAQRVRGPRAVAVHGRIVGHGTVLSFRRASVFLGSVAGRLPIFRTSPLGRRTYHWALILPIPLIASSAQVINLLTGSMPILFILLCVLVSELLGNLQANRRHPFNAAFSLNCGCEVTIVYYCFFGHIYDLYSVNICGS